MGCECSYTYEVSSVKCRRRLSTDLLLVCSLKKITLLLNIKRPICLVLNHMGLEPAAFETLVPVMTVGCLLHTHTHRRGTWILYSYPLSHQGSRGAGEVALGTDQTMNSSFCLARNQNLSIKHSSPAAQTGVSQEMGKGKSGMGMLTNR